MPNDYWDRINNKGDDRPIQDTAGRALIAGLDAAKVDKVTGKGLSTNDFTTEYKTKLDDIEAKAQVNNVWFCVVQSVDVTTFGTRPDYRFDFYMNLINRDPRDTSGGADRFKDGDMFIVFFNGVDTSQYRTQGPFYSVHFYIGETPQTTNKHDYKVVVNGGASRDDENVLSFFNAYSLRTFVYHPKTVSGTLQYSLTMAYSGAEVLQGDVGNSYGEVRLSNAIDSPITYQAATSYAVKRLKDIIDTITGGVLTYEVVSSLPVPPGISTTTIYLLPKQTPGTSDVYDEYINTTGLTTGWEKLGTTEIDLSQYYTKTETDTLLSAKADTSSLSAVATSGAASDVSYTNTSSGLTATDAQDAIDELKTGLNGKQDTLISGTSIKTVNGNTLLGSGDITTPDTNTWRPLQWFGTDYAGDPSSIKLGISSGSHMNIYDSYNYDDQGNITAHIVTFDISTNYVQEKLVSGSNIKTVNGNSILGAGDIPTASNISSYQLPSLIGTDFENSGWNTYGGQKCVICPANAWTSVGSVQFPAGVWIFKAYLYFYSNNTGYRGLCISSAKNTGSYDLIVPAVNGIETALSITRIIQASEGDRYFITGLQNAGNMYVFPHFDAVKISS